jgi:hypothetical protein
MEIVALSAPDPRLAPDPAPPSTRLLCLSRPENPEHRSPTSGTTRGEPEGPVPRNGLALM